MLIASAASLVIGAHLHTFHVGGDGDLPPALRNTDSTPGLYLRTESGVTLGIARNSLRRTSVYLAQTWTTDDERFAITLGGVTGYRYRTVRGQHVCRAGFTSTADDPCEFQHGKTSAHIRPLVAFSVALHEAAPYLGGLTPRVVVLGRAINLSIEARF